ncbi:hypothetical protein CBS115989_7089 [Aspergillus niger]|uniref:Uncharacterized protein n=3 Tax=Aspergillus niger TaxID=5061 RepID=A2R6E1_ASPNC|nr:uncharacterized protein BO96DRAFT_187970 [Aspergillus niger CBS 101883]XP_059602636.1 hypothetical protein An15g07620 [Aspergillus niger]RDH22106.1 hypothetical protein M747DRAFT_10478 [Aspergillus niger ATCC 13496]KAI2816176.1 hypothetical protein CBS115989_7089 [Aspergillus niger]KAI2849298.1 hypothetical protein CBS11232_6650 [Aspergillus niger]KAI2869539.1 hypothetical protein CBS115988_9950 [Aspergillus niger]PYH51696.1 hypothetical protein BO96DRAFT_187970 [Aspergillus niger CBS 1018
MQLKSIILALAFSAFAQAATIHGYSEKDCKGTNPTDSSSSKTDTCLTLEASNSKSLKGSPGDYVLTAFAETSCNGNGYALPPGKCINGDKFTTYEVQFIPIAKRSNATALLELYADYYAEFPEEAEELKRQLNEA